MHSNIVNKVKAALPGHHANDAENNRGVAAALGATGIPTPATTAVHDPTVPHAHPHANHHHHHENAAAAAAIEPRYAEENKGMATALGATGYTIPPTHAVHDPAVAHAGEHTHGGHHHHHSDNTSASLADPRYAEENLGMAAALGAAGIPVPPTKAVHDPAVAHAGEHVLHHNREGLAAATAHHRGAGAAPSAEHAVMPEAGHPTFEI
ncbi:hypothetical protein BDZ88DRAFT_442010 [Geranomyces variabilis]|nr:hypothetical protein BDZ88DRAFT_442010 [Geranomyces variabilis]KAJ3135336.1 hypothetical protein HDU90_004060 [Geranomyces variabilis]